jgi:hypothetical protein
LLALKEDVLIGGSDDEKGYGGFSARIKLPDDISFNAEYGEVEPTNLAVQASPWMDITGTLTGNGKKCGILIFCHPSNPGFPHTWIIRKQRSMQNPVYPGREPVLLPTSKPVVLHYRLVIHSEPLNTEFISKLYSAYENE